MKNTSYSKQVWHFEVTRDVTRAVPVQTPGATGHRLETIGTQVVTVEMVIDPKRVFEYTLGRKFKHGAIKASAVSGGIKCRVVEFQDAVLK